MKTLVVGLGNPILGDDGVGWRVVEGVSRLRPYQEVAFLSLGGLSLMERLIGYDRVILVDALQTGNGRIGSVVVCGLNELPNLNSGHTTAAHDTSLQTALDLGQQMGAKLPDEIIIVGIAAEQVYDFSDELTPTIAEAVPKAVTAVLNLL